MSIAGTWKLTVNTPMGTQNPTMTITEEGDGYKGSMDGPMGLADVEQITVDSANISFQVESDSPMGKIRMNFKGEMDGDSMSGEVATPMGPLKFSGER